VNEFEKGLQTMGGLSTSRHEASGPSDAWRRWEGLAADGFPLQRYLGGTEHSGVFLTQMKGASGDSKEAAIKLVSSSDVGAEKQLRQWKAAEELEHPNLLRILASGRCQLADLALLYVVMEYAEENLEQILPERALTAEETRGMLPVVLGALRYVQDKGLAHGRIQPSNILATGDQVKLSSDSLGVPGERKWAGNAYSAPESATGATSAAVDIWQLGVTLTEVLTQRLPRFDLQPDKQATLPEGIAPPFREIIENCLRIDPAKRWTVAQIADRLAGRAAIAPPEPARREPIVSAVSTTLAKNIPAEQEKKRPTNWSYVIALVAAALIAIFLIARPRPGADKASSAPPNASPGAVSAIKAAAPNGSAQPASAPESGAPVSSAATASAPAGDSDGRVIERVMPKISPGALHSVQGKIKIQVKVKVDETGRVTDARLKSRGPSRFFAERALEAARGWKFEPVRENGKPLASQWMVEFDLSRRAIDDSAVRIER
jgi:TonB family protein